MREILDEKKTYGLHKTQLLLTSAKEEFEDDDYDSANETFDKIIQILQIFSELYKKYPILLTCDLSKAKKWIKSKSGGNERYGLITSSNAHRMREFGIFLNLKFDIPNWFLNSKEDISSSYFMEYVATEFEIQGLEINWICVCWDADFRMIDGKWEYYLFKGTKWQQSRTKESVAYLKNAYRVLLTRARQGMIIFIPYGNEMDVTRNPNFYDETYRYLEEIGIQEL